MENHDKRPYQPVRVEMIGVESGLERFSKDGITTLPPISKWRNNLTALSQHENLFFIASEDCIAVYQPEFPFQTLRRQPALLIKPDLANRNAPGYLSSRRGGVEDHCINHLVVGDLGSQEILLFATDSGNVEAYYTSSILEAIKRASAQYDQGSSSDVLGLRPFFSQWVRQSAWGLDIHQEARMIAVSANVPSHAQPGLDEDTSATITVFAFALQERASPNSGSSDSSLDDPEAVEWITWDPRVGSGEPKRNRNYKVILAGWDGHGHNIPNICFVNTLEDCGGAWLLSTDITGEMKLWQIWKASIYRNWYFGTSENSVRPWINNSYPGWNVAAMDVSCFRPARNNAEFIGASKLPVYHGYHGQGDSFNITPVVQDTPGNSRYHPSHSDPSDTEPSSDGDQIHGESDDDGEDQPDPMEDVQSPSNPPLVPENADFDFVLSDHITGRELEVFGRAVEFEIETDDDSEYDEDDDDDEDESMGEDEQESPPTNPRLQRHIRRLATPIQNPNIKAPDIAMIHCGDRHVRLLGSPKAKFPHIFCANILRQILPHDIHGHHRGLEFMHMDRLNMISKIPELGLVLIATQTGRVAVCALSRRPDGLLGFRVDWVLPTKKQERNGSRPELCTLVGIAVAPVQGRWRPQTDASEDDAKSTFEEHDVDGVRTSFDLDVVVLRHPTTPQERNMWKSDKGSPPEPKIECRLWRMPQEMPAWQATETSRRIRVMLTYSDMSVLTYEMWRDVEKSEKA